MREIRALLHPATAVPALPHGSTGPPGQEYMLFFIIALFLFHLLLLTWRRCCVQKRAVLPVAKSLAKRSRGLCCMWRQRCLLRHGLYWHLRLQRYNVVGNRSDFFQKVINRVIHSAVTLPFPLGGLYYEGDMLTVLHRVALLPDSRNATVSRSKPLLMYSETNEEKEKC